MASKNNPIPVMDLPAGKAPGIIISRWTFDGSPDLRDLGRAHRDGGHSFFIQEQGITQIEVDFQRYRVVAPAVLYMHPSQVHRLIEFKAATISSWMITDESLQPDNRQRLEELTPVEPLPLPTDALALLSQTASLCIQLAGRTQEKLHSQLLKDSCNLLVALVTSQYLALAKPTHSATRFDGIAKAFRFALERDFTTIKSPASYAERLNLSTPYLNECVKIATGHSVSHHIQQRVVLEAKRLLHHSDQSVKEIAADLGYDDYSYFVRLFRKVAGVTPQAFRSKNLD